MNPYRNETARRGKSQSFSVVPMRSSSLRSQKDLKMELQTYRHHLGFNDSDFATHWNVFVPSDLGEIRYLNPLAE